MKERRRTTGPDDHDTPRHPARDVYAFPAGMF